MTNNGALEKKRTADKRIVAEVLRAWFECSDEVQESIREMVKIINDVDADKDTKDMAMFTILDALNFEVRDGKYGLDPEELEKAAAVEYPELREAIEELDQEEDTFAERLENTMFEKDVSQTELAKKIGVSQSAIANMLRRQCRPQRKTVMAIARALEVKPEELWPNFRK